MFKFVLLSVVVLQLATWQVEAGGLLGGGHMGIGNFGFGQIGGLKYGGIGSLRKSKFLGFPVSHFGGLYGKSLLLAPNPSEAQYQDVDGQMLANPTPMGGQPVFVDQQPQFYYDPQMARQFNPMPTQNFEYAYTDQMVGAPQDPNMQTMEDEQARFYKGNKGYGKGYYKGKGCGYQQSYGPSYGHSYGGYGGYQKGYGHGHGYGGGHSYGGYREATAFDDGAQLGAPATFEQQGFAPDPQQQQQPFYERANLMGDNQGQGQQIFMAPQQQQQMRYYDPQMDFQQQQQQQQNQGFF